ncbi:BMC domain-containing protein [Clostridium sp.]|uniref:BMC domain-containing protein n=1 Tax=Clostridium sp. TaxID=1506 RepID=UPI0026DC5670|nr:BMC domain-containing protein [Clostridium sp.]MDO5038601.1 BMC domain-containing protein [Clostridium sp.]
MNIFNKEDEYRVVQEYVPGKQVTLAHLIANPVNELYKKLDILIDNKGALGIMTITPGEAAIIAADVATKSSDVSIGFIDRFNGSLVIVGSVSSVEESLKEVIKVLGENLKFTSTKITKS